ncbi:MAG: glycerol-3-phosphate dehydrogenase/oxidase [Flavobacteriaceae bacterium]|nr:glycerol-3-phosphate dehydrogenase/oxidase [Flavobacteriaceae bacterium]
MTNRKHLISQLSYHNEWDTIIIGGGASGLGIAVDAASRGFKTVLFEQYDFAKGTSGKSTKLLHGGVRYLAQGDIKLVMEALEERGHLEKNARHLFKKLEFIIPNYSWWKGTYYLIGLKIYDWLSKRLSLGNSKLVSKKQALTWLPTLKSKGLANGVSYYDGQFDDARLAINLAQTAIEWGAVCINYMKVESFQKNKLGNIESVLVTDTETGKLYSVKGKAIINATGIFTDSVLKMYNPNHKKTVFPSQGIHLLLDRSFLDSDKAIMIPKTSDGRVLFIIPWHNKVMAGTTDTLIKKPKIEPQPLHEEVDFILKTINQYLTKTAHRTDVLSVFSGLRPLAKPSKEETTTKEVSRNHKIIIDNNLISIVGGKWTTYRKMAEDVIDQVIDSFHFTKVACTTEKISIHGNVSEKLDVPDRLSFYGSDLEAYLTFEKSNPEFTEKIHPHYEFTKGQVVWSIQNEMARTVEDFLSRRIRLLLLDAKAAVQATAVVASVMRKELQKTETWEQNQVNEFYKLSKKYILD